MHDPDLDDQTPEFAFPISPGQVWAMLQMQRTIILLFASVVVIVAVLSNLTATRQYRAYIVLHLTTMAGQELAVDQVVDRDMQYSWDDTQFYRTQFDLLRSRTLLEEVVRRYQVLGYDDLTIEDGGAASLGGMLSVARRTNSELVDLSITHTDADRAAVLANLVAEVYREKNLDDRRESAREARIWLQEQLETHGRKIDEQSRAVLEYQHAHDLADAEEEITDLSAQMTALNLALGEVNKNRVLLETSLKAHESLYARGEYDEAAADMNTELVRDLTVEYAEAVTENAAIAARYGEKYPERQYSEAKLERIQAELKREVQRTLSSERAQLGILRAKETNLQREIDATKQRLLARSSVYSEYAQLRSELERSTAFFELLSRRNDELDLTARTQLNNVRVVDEARPSYTPVEPRVGFNMMIAVVAGLLGGCVLGLLREYFDDTITSPLDVQTYLRVPYLGMVPKIGKVKDERALALYTHENPSSSVAEAMRALRTILELNPTGQGMRRLLVTSSVASEGKTSTTMHLGVAYANLGRKVLMIDADLRRPRLHKIFDVAKDAGLSLVLTGGDPKDAIMPSGVPGLDYMPAGMTAERPNELLASKALADLLDRLALQYDLIIIDSPPSAILSDAAILSRHVDGVVMVVREGRASRMLVREAIQRLHQIGANVLGVAINDVDVTGRGASYKYYYGYRYRYDKYYEEARDDAAAK